MMLEIDIESDEEWDSSTDWSLLVRRAAESALAESAFPQLAEGSRQVEISVRLTSDEDVRALNAHWRGKDKPTNVLSFPADPLPAGVRRSAEESDELGDLAICAPVVAREAREQGKSPQAHWAHMVVHGVLHLLGYDHENDRDAERMESKEAGILAQFGYPNPYA